MPKIGFFHQGALGDFILFMPVLDGIAEIQSSVSFELWTRPSYGCLFYGKLYRLGIHPYDAEFWRAFFLDNSWKDVPIPENLALCDTFFWVGQEGSREVVERLQKKLPFPVRWIQSFPARKSGKPVTQFLADQFTLLGWDVEDTRPSVRVDPEAEKDVAGWLEAKGIRRRKFMTVHIGSGGISKVWPLGRWQGFLSYIFECSGRPVVLLSGPADGPFEPFVSWVSGRYDWPVVRGFTLERLAALLRLSEMYVGCDSGVSHLAGAVGVPAMVIVRQNGTKIWAPRGKNVNIYQDQWHNEEVLCWDTDRDAVFAPSLRRKFDDLIGQRAFAFLRDSIRGVEKSFS